MSGLHTPGPIGLDFEQWSIDDGTMPLFRMPLPATSSAMTLAMMQVAARQAAVAPDIGFLFRSCLNPQRGIDDAAWEAAATRLGVEAAAIRAVAEVESKTGAFDVLGRPTILYERHYFHRLTDGRYSEGHARISQSTSGGYGKFSEQYDKLEKAYALDAEAALRSASWGRFQIMGDNHSAAGFGSVQAFVRAMTVSEAEHLRAFVQFVANDAKMVAALRAKDWAAFAKRYNGPGYLKNKYDTKMKAEYDRLSEKAAQEAARKAAAKR